MQGVYKAKYTFRGINIGLNEAINNENKNSLAKSTPTSPKPTRVKNAVNNYNGENCIIKMPPADVIFKKSPTLCVKLEKCNSEPNVFDNKKDENTEIKISDQVSMSITALPCQGSKSENSLAGISTLKRNSNKQKNELILEFAEGDLFQILSKEVHEHWWAVSTVNDHRTGFVPANYLIQANDDDLSDTNNAAEEETIQEIHQRALAELRQRVEHLDLGVLFPTGMIPEPELCPTGEELEKRNRRNTTCPGPSLPMLNSEGLILPRKPPNPCLESSDHKNLHRELMFNQKIGKNVLNQKSELQKALEKHKEHQVKKELQIQRDNSKTAFEKVIEERARRLESMEKTEDVQEKCANGAPEFLQVHAKLRARMDSK